MVGHYRQIYMGHSELSSTGKKCSAVSCPHRERPTVGSIAAVYSQHAQQCGAQVCLKVHYRHQLVWCLSQNVEQKNKNTTCVSGANPHLSDVGPKWMRSHRTHSSFVLLGPYVGLLWSSQLWVADRKELWSPLWVFPGHTSPQFTWSHPQCGHTDMFPGEHCCLIVKLT